MKTKSEQIVLKAARKHGLVATKQSSPTQLLGEIGKLNGQVKKMQQMASRKPLPKTDFYALIKQLRQLLTVWPRQIEENRTIRYAIRYLMSAYTDPELGTNSRRQVRYLDTLSSDLKASYRDVKQWIQYNGR